MARSSMLRGVSSGVYRIKMNNSSVLLPDDERHANHVYLVKPSSSHIKISPDSLSAEISYPRKPLIRDEHDELYIYYDRISVIKTVVYEELRGSEKHLTGRSKPLTLKIREEGGLVLIVNDKYYYRSGEMELNVDNVSSIVNIMVYPFKMLWIYVEEGSINMKRTGDKLVVNISSYN